MIKIGAISDSKSGAGAFAACGALRPIARTIDAAATRTAARRRERTAENRRA